MTLTILGEVSLQNLPVLSRANAEDEQAWLVHVGPSATRFQGQGQAAESVGTLPSLHKTLPSPLTAT